MVLSLLAFVFFFLVTCHCFIKRIDVQAKAPESLVVHLPYDSMELQTSRQVSNSHVLFAQVNIVKIIFCYSQ